MQNSKNSDMVDISELRCLNELQSKEWRIYWTIYDFVTMRSSTPLGQALNSSKFQTGLSSDNQWYLSLYPSGKTNYPSDICVHLVSTKDVNTSVNFSFSIINEKGEKYNHKTFNSTFSGSLSCGSDQFILYSAVTDSTKGLLVKNSLTLCCEIQISKIVSNKCQIINFFSNMNNLGTDLLKLFTNSILTDVKIVAGNKVFEAHKAIVASRSPVFAAMFEHNMKENNSNVVTIADIEPKVMHEILYFMYSNVCPRLNEMAIDLLRCADMYDLQELKEMTEEYLFSQLTISNAANTLLLADQCNSKRLKSKSIKFIISNGKEVIKSDDWASLVTCGNLLFELTTTLFSECVLFDNEILLSSKK